MERYLAGMDRSAFEWARDAIERCIERVCEATVRLGERADELMPEQPWGTSAAWATGCGVPLIDPWQGP